MEWVETTGRTVEEALDAALDQLGVHEDEVEYEVVEEPKVGLFGRLRGDARIRARVRPIKPRPKEDRRDRRRRNAGKASGATATESSVDLADVDVAAVAALTMNERTEAKPKRSNKRRGNESHEEEAMSETGVDVPLASQAEVAADFLRGLLDAFALTATVAVHEIDEDTVEVAIEGDDLGLLIGPKGATLSAIQDLARTVVQRKTSARNGRLLVDVAGYRQRRKTALERFARNAADQVLSSGSRVVLEPMNPADRKVIHDTINDIPGVSTTSEGEEPRRRVVLLPEASASA